MGTAYPVSYGKRCIYTASEHSLQIYEIDTAKQQLSLKAEYEIIFDETEFLQNIISPFIYLRNTGNIVQIISF